MATPQLQGSGLENLSGNFQNLIEDQIHIREALDPLYENLRYRAEYEEFYAPGHIGQRFTFTNLDIMDDADDAITPPANSDLDSGMAAATAETPEEFDARLEKYGNTLDTHLLSSSLSLENQYILNMRALGRNAGRSIEKVARRHMFAAYGGGNSYLTANVSNSNSANVANIFGMDWKQVSGVPTAVSASNPLGVTIGSNAVNITAVSGVSIDKNIDWASGTLTLDANVTNVTGDQVLVDTAPRQIDPNGLNQNPYEITTSDDPTLNMILDMVAYLEDDSVPPADMSGYYHFITDPITLAKLQQTQAFREIFRGRGNDDVFTRGAFGAFGNVLFYKSQLAPKATKTVNSGSVSIKHMIAIGEGLGYEARYGDVDKLMSQAQLGGYSLIDQFLDTESWTMFQTRAPLDRHGEVIAQSWKFLGGFALRTDYERTGQSRNYVRAIVGRVGASA